MRQIKGSSEKVTATEYAFLFGLGALAVFLAVLCIGSRPVEKPVLDIDTRGGIHLPAPSAMDE